MQLALIGYGRMGKLIERIARERGHAVRSIDPQAPDADHRSISAEALDGAEVAIDFSSPQAALPNIRAALELGVNLVVGTTGWYDQLPEVRQLVECRGAGFLYASNFSVGVNLFCAIVKQAAQIMDRVDFYDAALLELHHNRKADSPSGTAQTLAGILTQELHRKTSVITDRLDRAPGAQELHVASLRCGAFPGRHEVIFDSPADTITLTHSARSREGFAQGALLAAEWLRGRKGFFTIQDFMSTLL